MARCVGAVRIEADDLQLRGLLRPEIQLWPQKADGNSQHLGRLAGRRPTRHDPLCHPAMDAFRVEFDLRGQCLIGEPCIQDGGAQTFVR